MEFGGCVTVTKKSERQANFGMSKGVKH